MSLTALYDVPAPAKLNLFLHVTGRRTDGYHLLQSMFVLLDWCDTLHFERRGGGQLSRTDLGPPLPADDLSLRAARLLQQASGCSWGAHIAIQKEVPWGAGLGGGSSDAATTLVALNRLWQLGWPRERLITLGLQLGADVPFFLGGHNAWVEGIGEQLTPIEVPSMNSAVFAVLKPPIVVPTQAIFTSPLLSRNSAPAIVADFLADPFGFGHNDLQAAATHYAAKQAVDADGPGDIAQALRLLTTAFGASRMTGSGSAVFARVDGKKGETSPADKLARLMATGTRGWSGRVCKGLETHPLLEWTLSSEPRD